jgi:hypothetical protein
MDSWHTIIALESGIINRSDKRPMASIINENYIYFKLILLVQWEASEGAGAGPEIGASGGTFGSRWIWDGKGRSQTRLNQASNGTNPNDAGQDYA